MLVLLPLPRPPLLSLGICFLVFTSWDLAYGKTVKSANQAFGLLEVNSIPFGLVSISPAPDPSTHDEPSVNSVHGSCGTSFTYVFAGTSSGFSTRKSARIWPFTDVRGRLTQRLAKPDLRSRLGSGSYLSLSSRPHQLLHGRQTSTLLVPPLVFNPPWNLPFLGAKGLTSPEQTATGVNTPGSDENRLKLYDLILGDDASKQGRIDIGDINTDAEITLIDETQGRINDIIADEDITLIPKLIIKLLKIVDLGRDKHYLLTRLGFLNLQKDDYDTWAMEMEHYLEYIDNEVWKVIQNGNSKKRVTKGKDGVYRVLPPTTQEEQFADEKERKARTLLLMAVPKDHLRRFHGMDDAKEIWAAIKTRFGGNGNSKKMQRKPVRTEKEALMTIDEGQINWVEQTADEELNHALMAFTVNNEVSMCSKLCLDSYNALQAKYDELQSEFGDQEAALTAHKLGLKKLESQLRASHKQQISLNEKLHFQANQIFEKDEKLKITNLTQETLLGPTFRLLKGTRSNYAELEYDFEECYKALSEKLNWEKLEGDDYPFDLTKPLPLVMSRNHQKVPVYYFFKNDLKYLQGGNFTMTYTTSLTKKKASQYDFPGIEDMVPNIWSPVKVAYDKHALWGISYWRDQLTQVEVMRKHGYRYLKDIVVERAETTFTHSRIGDFPRLCIIDIEDM
ncbi:hypothetical protein Tco_1165659 [Tanacetum coccineum]